MNEFRARMHEYEIDIDKGLRRYPIKAPLAVGDSMADRFRLKILKGGEAVDLTGCTVTGLFIRPDFQTIRGAGTIAGNECEFVLEEDCYSFEGAYEFAVNIESTSNNVLFQTVAVFEGLLIPTQTDTFYDESEVSYLLTASGDIFIDAGGNNFVVMEA